MNDINEYTTGIYTNEITVNIDDVQIGSKQSKDPFLLHYY